HIRVDPHRGELADIEIELLARDLQHAGGVALPELALSENDGRGVVGMHRDPGIDQVGIWGAPEVRARGTAKLRREAKADDERAAPEEIAARKCGVGKDSAHGVSPAMTR